MVIGVPVILILLALMIYGLISFSSNAQYDIGKPLVKQSGINATLKWRDAGAPRYRILVFKERKHGPLWLQRPKEYCADKSQASIELKQLDKEYGFLIFAENESGHLSSVAWRKLQTKKVNQAIKAQDTLEGIKGKTTPINAKAKGAISFRSDDDRIVSINKDSEAVFNREGKATVTITASETPQYKPAKKVVSVIAYPDKLRSPTVKMENTSDLETVLSWEPVRYAQQYILYKKNPETKKFEEQITMKKDATSISYIRNNGEYRLKAKAVINGEHLESEDSNISIESPAMNVESRSSSHSLGTIDLSNTNLITKISGDGSICVPQSMSRVGDRYVICFVNHSGSKGVLASYDVNGNHLDKTSVSGMGHANGSTYIPKTGKIYTVKTHKSIWSPSCTSYDTNNGYEKDTFNLPKNTSGIAYDASEHKVYLSKGNELYITDPDNGFKIEKSMRKTIRYHHAQDIAAANGVILVCTWPNGDESYIDLYRVRDGGYLGSYEVPIGEIESCYLEEDKHLVLLMNNCKKHGDCLLRTKDPVTFP